MQQIEIARPKPETVVLMRSVIADALTLYPSLNTPEKKAYFINLMVQFCASSYMSGMITTARCELTVDDIIRVANTRQAPFTEKELRAAFDIIVDNTTHGLGGNTDK